MRDFVTIFGYQNELHDDAARCWHKAQSHACASVQFTRAARGRIGAQAAQCSGHRSGRRRDRAYVATLHTFGFCGRRGRLRCIERALLTAPGNTVTLMAPSHVTVQAEWRLPVQRSARLHSALSAQ